MIAIESKTVNRDDFYFTLMTSKNGIAPELISYKEIGNQFVIEMEKCPNLLAFSNQYLTTYREKVKEQIRKLHSLGIYHGNLSSENIVINPVTDGVMFIDFSQSEWIVDRKQKSLYKDLTPEVVKNYLERDEIANVMRLEFVL